nr:immunoglobulin light chain junction region [Macaca mulatta]MOW14905.1 immunoglobulin light chain junction region [Macaca mulatta]MOW15010.1 immunoglobulin light chain junction region [Macaca mulatta]MOW15097.1 immunoglobulin light chain junction region [Macaca mulatta]MOW15099.1 immunoglobulin light chain junction region [Macaca mulatta]
DYYCSAWDNSLNSPLF